jgi:hypothetical protein
MRPHRVRLTHSLVENYDLPKMLKVHKKRERAMERRDQPSPTPSLTHIIFPLPPHQPV